MKRAISKDWTDREIKLKPRWQSDGSVCPACDGPGRESERYPAAVCEACEKRVVDQFGNRIELYNESFSGGLRIVAGSTVHTGAEAEALPLFIDRIECRAQEHRFGGVVVQPVQAWNRER